MVVRVEIRMPIPPMKTFKPELHLQDSEERIDSLGLTRVNLGFGFDGNARNLRLVFSSDSVDVKLQRVVVECVLNRVFRLVGDEVGRERHLAAVPLAQSDGFDSDAT